MERVDFYQLTRAIQDRVVAATKGQGVPTPLLVSRSGVYRAAVAWLWVATAGLLGLILLYGIGMGDLENPLAIHRRSLIGLYAVFTTALLFGLMRAQIAAKKKRMLPFRAGIYLFPTVIIDARNPVFRTFVLSESTRIDTTRAPVVRVVLPEGGQFEFLSKSAEHAQEVTSVLATSRVAIGNAKAAQDKAAIATLDPLAEPNFVNPFTPKKSLAFVPHPWAKYSWAIGPVLGTAVGFGIFQGHNRMSDARMFARAKSANTPRAYALYIERGGTQVEAKSILLPRSELKDAVNSGSLEAIERFAASHPNTGIEGEIRNVLRNTMLNELSRITKAGTMASLATFKERHDTKIVASEYDRAVHGFYRAAFERYKATSSGNAQAVSIVERMLDSAEKRGPKVELRFVRRIGKTVEAADSQIKKSPFFMGQPSIASQYFDEPHARRREEEVGRKIVARFNDAFSPDVLHMELGAAVADADAPLPAAVAVPTFFVEHTVQLSGPSYLSANPRGVFVGLGVTYEVTSRIPDDPRAPYKWKTTSWKAPVTTLEKGTPNFEETVYTTMADESYHKVLGVRLLKEFFKNPEGGGAKGAEAATSSGSAAPGTVEASATAR